MATHCPNCGHSVEEDDRFCRQCGASLALNSGVLNGTARLNPENVSIIWKNFFGPFFKTAFIFFCCFFGLALLLILFWYFTFRV